MDGPNAIAPLVVRVEGFLPTDPDRNRHRYYFWFFGYVAKLPYERIEAPPRGFSDAERKRLERALNRLADTFFEAVVEKAEADAQQANQDKRMPSSSSPSPNR